MRKKIIFVITAVVLVAAAVLSAVRISFLNEKYPDPQIVEYKTGEKIDGGAVKLRINRTEMLDGGQFKKVCPEYVEDVYDYDGNKITEDQYRVILIYADVINETSELQSIGLGQFRTMTKTWSNGIESTIYNHLNDVKDKEKLGLDRVDVEAGKSKAIILPYVLYDFQFHNDEWENIKNDDFLLSMSYYPVKYVVDLDIT